MKMDGTITKKSFNRNKYLKTNFTSNVIGQRYNKLYTEVGFYFLPK